MKELWSDVYLISSEDLMIEQAGWDDEDESKDTDFTTHPWWLWVDNGSPVGLTDIQDLYNIL